MKNKSFSLLSLMAACAVIALTSGCTTNTYDRKSYDPQTGQLVEAVRAKTKTVATQRSMDRLHAQVTDTNGINREFTMERYKADPDEAAIRETGAGVSSGIKAVGEVIKEVKTP